MSGMTKLIITALLLSVLSACAIVPQQPSGSDQVRGDYLLELSSWSMNMSLLAKTPQAKYKARLQWQQMPEQYQIRVRDFIGRTIATIQGTPQIVVAKTVKGRRYENVDADLLLAELTGLQVPVNGLQYWLLGLTDPRFEVQAYQTDTQGLPQVIQQMGWTIRYQAYQAVGSVAMPERIKLDQDGVSLQLKISHWQLNDSYE